MQSKASLLKERWDGAIEVAATAQNSPDGIQAVLPPADTFIGRHTVLTEYEVAARFENPGHLAECPLYVGQGTQGIGDEHGVRTLIA